jgi:hypothetical protein
MRELRTSLTLLDEIERLAHEGELTGDRLEALAGSIGEHCKVVLLGIRGQVLQANNLEISALIDIAATALLRMRVLHVVDLLKPKEFDVGMAQARAALTRADAIAGPDAEEPPAPAADLIEALPLTRMRFVGEGRRQFGVIEGGRA